MTTEHEGTAAVVARWFDECCVVDKHGYMSVSESHGSYMRWCARSGERASVQRMGNGWSRHVQALGLLPHRTQDERGFKGARLTA